MIFDKNAIVVALLFIGFDFVTGIFSAIKTGTFKSSIMRQGLVSKCGTILIIAFGIALDVAQHMYDLGLPISITNSICVYTTFMNIMSCIENFDKGFPGMLPPAIKNMLASKTPEQ